MKTKILLFPGLGADENLFIEQKKEFSDFITTPRWIPYKNNETLNQYVSRWSDELVSGLHGYDQIVLGGFSFGGIIALELAYCLNEKHKIPVSVVALISSGIDEKINKFTFKLQAAIVRYVPRFFLELALQFFMNKMISNEKSLSIDHKKIINQMRQAIDYDFFRWSAYQCAQWKPSFNFGRLELLGTKLYAIQGELDPIIPTLKINNALTIKRAKHFIQFTNANEVNQWLKKALNHA